MIKKILKRELFLYYSLFYLLFKYTFFNQGRFLTYILFGYSILIYIYDIYTYKGIYKFKGYIFSYLMCISAVVSCLVVAHKITISSISGIMIFFVNFFMYLPIFHSKGFDYIKKIYQIIFFTIICYSFLINLIGVIFAIFGKEIFIFGTQFGAVYGKRLVTVRETANETGWFAIFSIVSSIYFIYNIITNKLLLSRKNVVLAFLSINIIIQITTYILSGNRSSMIGILAAILVILYIYFSTKKMKYFKIALFVFTLLSVVFVFAYVLLKSMDPKGSEIARLDMIVFGILYTFSFNPIFGNSYVNLSENIEKNYEMIYSKYNFITSKTYLRTLTTSGNAHNVFIQQLETNGILGIIILISFFVYVAKETIFFSKNIIKEYSLNIEKVVILFFIVFGFVVGNISWNIVGTITCFVNLLFFLSISAVLSLNILTNKF